MGNSILGIKDLIDFMNFLKGKSIDFSNFDCAIYYVEEQNVLIVDTQKIKPYKKVPELTKYRFIEDMKLLEVMSGNYIPIIDKDSKELL